MNFDILLPIKPYYAYLIMKGEKTIEVRKFNIKDPNWSGKFKCYVSKDKTSLKRILQADRAEFEKYLGKVAFEFVSDEAKRYESEFWDADTYECIRYVIEPIDFAEYGEHEYYTFAECGEDNELCKAACLKWEELRNYIGQGIREFYGYHITALKVYDKPRELGEFRTRLSDTDIRCKYRKKCSNLYSDKQKNLCTKINDGYKRECDFNRLGWQTDCSEYEPMGKERPITRPPQSYMYCEPPKDLEDKL